MISMIVNVEKSVNIMLLASVNIEEPLLGKYESEDKVTGIHLYKKIFPEATILLFIWSSP